VSTKGLVVVDVQNDFVEHGALPVMGGLMTAERIASDLLPKVGEGKEYECAAFTKDWHIDPGEHWVSRGEEPDYNVSWPVHCNAMEGYGADLVPILSDAIDGIIYPDGIFEDEVEERVSIFRKGQYAAAYSGVEGKNTFDESLLEWLNIMEVDSVDVVGLALDYCVKATALDLADAGLRVRVLGNYSAPVHHDTISVLTVLGTFNSRGVEYVSE